jgi:MFS family permease
VGSRELENTPRTIRDGPQFCDRHGRTKILGITVIGALLTDLNFIIIATFPDKLPGGYWLLLVGPLFEGVLGGMIFEDTITYIISECDSGLASGTAANHAYLADITTEETR